MTTSNRFTVTGYYSMQGEFYVWDTQRSSICNPDTGRADVPWRKLLNEIEAQAAAALLNNGENDMSMWELQCVAHLAFLKEQDLA